MHPVPFMKSMHDGNQKHIIVLTSSCPPSEWMRKLSRVERLEGLNVKRRSWSIITDKATRMLVPNFLGFVHGLVLAGTGEK